MERKFRRVSFIDEGWLGGVCAGFAYYIGCPIWIVRLAWVGAVLGLGAGILLYILLWIFLPEWERLPKDFYKITGD